MKKWHNMHQYREFDVSEEPRADSLPISRHCGVITKLSHCGVIFYLLAGFKTIILCSVRSI